MYRADNRRRGFALIVVLSTLSIIALLFAIASSRVVSRLSENRTDGLVAEDAFARASLLGLAAQVYSDRQTPLGRDTLLPVRWRGEHSYLHLQDAGGLVDLNTALPVLLERLAEAMDVSSAQLEEYRRWRKTPLRLQRVSDFVRVTGGDALLNRPLFSIATVFSGRQGIAMEFAPQSMLGILSGSTDGKAGVIRGLPSDWATPPSGTNYHVNIMTDGMPSIPLGVINIGAAESGKILSLF